MRLVIQKQMRILGILALMLVLCAVVTPAFAQSVNVDLGQGANTSARLVQIILLVTVLTLAPSILIMVTCFTRIIVVLSFLRTALGTQQTPPSTVLVSLALFLTMFVMQPTFDKAWENGIRPLINNQIDEETSLARASEPFHEFMLKHTRERDLKLFDDISHMNDKLETKKAADAAVDKNTKAAAPKPAPQAATEKEDMSMRALIPAFMISELRRAFEIGFMLFLPFLIIDMVIASILMAMGMAMLPPSVISLPFKIIFFVLVDGWYLVCGSLVQSYGG
jgi:flagellar biosynthetic protein FliP